MISISNSIRARFINYKAAHYDLFREGRVLASLKNIHKGERCFIIGNGPSLKAKDLDLLQAQMELSFAFNRIFYIFSQTSWRPTYYISQDYRMLQSCVAEVNKIPAKMRMIPSELKWYYNIDISLATYFHLKNRHDPETPVFSNRINKCIYNSNTVVITAIQIAIYMGFKDIYLLGVDHRFHTSINSRGEILIDNKVDDYFTKEYNADKRSLYIPNLEKSTQDFIAIKSFAEAHSTRVYNCTRGGNLEVFDRIDFDSLF